MLLPVGQHQQTDLALGIAFGRSGHGGKDHPVAVLHQRVPKVGQTRLLAVAVPVQPSRRGRWSTYGFVGALLATKIRAVDIVRTILPLEALLRIPGPARHADDGEVIVRYQPPGLLQHANACAFWRDFYFLSRASKLQRPGPASVNEAKAKM